MQLVDNCMNLLLHYVGPRSCGKKTIARAVAGEAEVPFVKVEGGDAETLKRAFVVAKARAPCVLFVDGDPLIENVGIRMQLKQVAACWATSISQSLNE